MRGLEYHDINSIKKRIIICSLVHCHNNIVNMNMMGVCMIETLNNINVSIDNNNIMMGLMPGEYG